MRDLFLVTNRLLPDDGAVAAVRDALVRLFTAEVALFAGPE